MYALDVLCCVVLVDDPSDTVKYIITTVHAYIYM